MEIGGRVQLKFERNPNFRDGIFIFDNSRIV